MSQRLSASSLQAVPIMSHAFTATKQRQFLKHIWKTKARDAPASMSILSTRLLSPSAAANSGVRPL